jgi:exodeoxyribonuclease V alpha subunit
MASHKIHQGKSPLVNVPNLDSEFQFIPIGDEEKIVAFIVEAAAKLKGRDANFQVLSPKYEGGVGVNLLNERLKERLNPSSSKREWKLGSSLIREGDRLMVIKNDYLLNIYNGDMGKLKSIEGDHLVVTIHGIGVGSMDTQVKIPKASASRLLKLAYAITVHKSQGSEFDTILLPITRSQGRMLQRNLFYTAVTRARKKVWLLGDSEAVLRAIDNDQVVQRNTVLGRVLSYICSSGVGCPHD